MRRSLGSDIKLLNSTNEIVLSHSGKQLRPIIALLFAKACSNGSLSEDTYKSAAAVELLHNATLLHDDVADDSAVRRGVPTVMSLLGPSAAVLLGDYWLVKCIDNILALDNEPMRVIRTVAKTLSDLAEGELLQLQKASSCDTDFNDYIRIIYNKTASLFEASAVCGALSVSAPDEMTEAAKSYAYNLGLAFQIKDDIFDYLGSDSLGKPVGIDIKEQKITMPLLGALDNVSAEKALEIRAMVKSVGDKPELVDEIRNFVKSNGGIEAAVKVLNDYIDKAVKSLAPIPDCREKDLLTSLARFVGDRNK
ncbi:MAG: polyprenyl synthetase family protein [Bacteroidales bacterium]|nr:polyprenyl synthetase family protein [Bacteroidales bacterium]